MMSKLEALRIVIELGKQNAIEWSEETHEQHHKQCEAFMIVEAMEYEMATGDGVEEPHEVERWDGQG